ncbi:hypothetical protein BCF59_0346 [Mycoplasmopsis mustelae]|uniref:Uncharacterized protein n=1 Tax=Mycoplasmopsis mustelae TaxID=171289 RepID=A0A4R7UEM5_9BACT|nr:hypothetical protein [Mycoplasmopsis mustelae]TDV24381.1 hypothetical protein BCF59_0346 [Mycoplasmopsis mustelae]
MNFKDSQKKEFIEGKGVEENLLLLSLSNNWELKKELKWFQKNIDVSYKPELKPEVSMNIIKEDVSKFQTDPLYDDLYSSFVDLKLAFFEKEDVFMDNLSFYNEKETKYLIDYLKIKDNKQHLTKTTQVILKNKDL